ncbi:hypothetical protein SGGMMB4_02093 [Sodalis glossinidius str. 'morsitans']|uniref:Uncharacterized protein n=1 Tax=Sodalis glossinidius (strain morsitans) TaxID=343509 RepID=A0A193QHZ6_SODGM|nr:hypothetical protein [Sodalis glossinidius]CRL44791.1 hypothetical protein SGGMMB4_02093 [Sodalis glossinidius str. 'morsitans']
MENAKTRKNSAVEFISRHLVASAYQAIVRVRQTNITKMQRGSLIAPLQSASVCDIWRGILPLAVGSSC